MIFERSRNAMLLADDRRHYTDANAAACRLLRTPREELLTRRIDDYTPPELRDQMEELWTAFLQEGSQAGTFELWLPGGDRLEAEYSATANVFPGRHLSVLLSPVPEPTLSPEPERGGAASLSPREREVLELVALGAGTAEIASRLVIAEETVRNHVKNALGKLGAHNRAHAVAIAVRRGELAL